MTNNNKNFSFHRLLALFAILLTLTTVLVADQNHRTWSYNLSIYEVNVRQYTEEGTFAAFQPHLNRLQEMGVGILWFMPIHPIGRQNRLGSLGSYYSVRDYMDINPEFGTLSDFQALVMDIHQRGMYVILDWVANHTAWDHPLTIEHPEWYSKDAAGNFIAPPGTNWSDVIELDYSQQGLREYMVAAMKFWMLEVGVDGFRCDAVSMVPKDFWREAFAELKAIKPDLFILAEADGREWHDIGFDMTFAWGLYGFGSGVLKRIADQTNTAANLNTYMTVEKTTYTGSAYRMYFTSNHDENSWHGTPSELFGDASEAFSVLTATANAMPLIYCGQEAGLEKRLRFFDKDQIIWRDHVNIHLYTKLLRLKRENRALWNAGNGGPIQRVQTSNNVDIFAFARVKEDDKVLVVLNLSPRQQTVTLKGTSFIGSYRNLFTDEFVTLTADDSVTLAAWGYVVYTFTGANAVPTGAVPHHFRLDPNYPNPFNSSTTITYALTTPSLAKFSVYDLLGREIHIQALGDKPAGKHEISFSATDLPSGVYLYHLQAGKNRQTKKMIIIK